MTFGGPFQHEPFYDAAGCGLEDKVSVMSSPGCIPPGQLSVHSTAKTCGVSTANGSYREMLGFVAHKCLQTVLGF